MPRPLSISLLQTRKRPEKLIKEQVHYLPCKIVTVHEQTQNHHTGSSSNRAPQFSVEVPEPLSPRDVKLGKTLCWDSTTAGMTVGKRRSFFAFAGLQTPTLPLSTSQDGSQVAGTPGLTPKEELYIPVSFLLPVKGSGITKVNQQPQLTTFFT